MTISTAGKDMDQRLAEFSAISMPCLQIDCDMADAGVESAVKAALQHGYVFCGWLPGFGPADVLRLQKIDETNTDLEPVLVNPVAQGLLGQIRLELGI